MKLKDDIRVAMLIDCYGGRFLGGGQTHVRELVRALESGYGCDVSIFSQENPSTIARFLWNLQVIPRVIKAHKSNPFQVIHAQAFSAGIAGILLRALLHIPVIYSVHGCHTLDMVSLGLQKKDWKYYLEKLLLTRITYNALISDSSHFIGQYANVNKHIYVIENGTVLDNRQYIASDNRNKNKNGNSNQLNLLTVGRLEKVKGVEYLLYSIAKLQDKKNIKLRIIGDGSLGQSLKELHLKLGLTEMVRFIGPKTGLELEQEYAKADLFVLPSVAEGQPIVVLDAWMHKIPVLATKAGHNPWMIEDGKDGYLAEVADVNSLVTKLEQAIKHKDALKEMGMVGYEKVKHTYTWDMAAQKTLEVYKNVIYKQ